MMGGFPEVSRELGPPDLTGSNMKIVLGFCASIICASLPASSFGQVPDDQVYTLYRNSILDPNMRVHFATFDAVDREGYNFENCQQTQALIMAQKDEPKRFWCERGRFKK